MKIGLQLYSVRDCIHSGEDFRKVLKEVKGMGYEGVEFAGYAGLTPEEIKDALDESGLIAVSSHESVDRLENNLEEIISYTLAHGAKIIACSYSPTGSEADLERLQRVMEAAKAAAEPHGIAMAYHNHSHEFLPLPDGIRPIDRIQQFSRLEPDTYWVYHSGVSPAQYLLEHVKDIALVHLKDGDENGHPCAVGEGKNDIADILKASEKIGTEWVIVENDNPVPDGLSDVRRSMEWIKAACMRPASPL